MTSITNVKTFQFEEIIAIKNIYQNEFKSLRSLNKKNFKPPKFSVLVDVKPEKEINSHLGKSLELIIDCSDKYPFEAPNIYVEHLKNINTHEELNLLQKLKSTAEKNVNNQMMHLLIEECREFLRHIIDQKIKEKEIPTSKPIVNIKTLNERKEKIKKTENEKVKFEQCRHVYSEESAPANFNTVNKTSQIRVLIGKCDGEHKVSYISSKSRLVCNEYSGYNITGGYGVRIRQLSIYHNSAGGVFHYLDNDFVMNLSNDLMDLSKLSHPNIISYVASKITQNQIKKTKEKQICIQYIVFDKGYKSLKDICDKWKNDTNGSQLPEDLIRRLIQNIVDAIKYLHEKNISYIKIDMNTLLVDASMKVHISQYGLGKRFQELSQYDNNTESLNDSSKKEENSTQFTDIRNIGNLAKELYYYGVLEEDQDEESILSNLLSFIECTRDNPSQIYTHEYIKDKANTENDSKKDELNNMNSQTSDDALNEWRFFDNHSRIPTEFEVIECLGSGAFGSVVKVKNKYDNQFYAIKRVRMSKLKKKAEKRTMKEVQLLSSLNHENIVRYYATWSEDADRLSIKTDDATPTNSFIIKRRISSSLHNNLSTGKDVMKKSIGDTGLIDLSSSFVSSGPKFLKNFDDDDDDDDDDEDDYDDDDAVDDGDDAEDDLIEFEKSHGGFKDDTSNKNGSKSNFRSKSNTTQKYLMIQMELCEGSKNTLQKWIHSGQLYKNEKLIWKFIREIVAGLDHIHSKNMIHRDLKPGNIFIDSSNRIKLGDLGLAVDLTESNLSVAGGPVGTSFYICPEMITCQSYTAKADMYSLGIIVFEMRYHSFSTGSERVQVLNELRKQEIIFPSDWKKNDDKFKTLITALLDHDSTKRPSSAELMQYDLVPPPEAREMELRKHLLRITNDHSSSLFKLLLKKMFDKIPALSSQYDVFLSDQQIFHQFLWNCNYDEAFGSQIKSKINMNEELIKGDFQYFQVQHILEKLVISVMRLHGAVSLPGPMLIPNSDTIRSNNQISLLDSEGLVIHLPSDLRENFISFINNNGIKNCRRYALGLVFNQTQYKGYHPRQETEAAFDIVTGYDDFNSKIECFFILESILKVIFREKVMLDVIINDTRIFYAIMEYFKIPTNYHHKLSYLCHEGVLNKENLEIELLNDLSLNDSQFQLLKQILSYSGDLESFEKYLKDFSNRVSELKCCSNLLEAYKQLKQLCDMIKTEWNVDDKCSINWKFTPHLISSSLLTTKLPVYSSIVFQFITKFPSTSAIGHSCDMSDKNIRRVSKNLNSPRIIISGGAYGCNCNKNMTSKENQCNYPHGFGFSINITSLTQCLHNLSRIRSAIFHLPSRNIIFQVLIENDIKNDERFSLKLLRLFWSFGISATLYNNKCGNAISNVMKQTINLYLQINPTTTTNNNNTRQVMIMTCPDMNMLVDKSMDIEMILHESMRLLMGKCKMSCCDVADNFYNLQFGPSKSNVQTHIRRTSINRLNRFPSGMGDIDSDSSSFQIVPPDDSPTPGTGSSQFDESSSNTNINIVLCMSSSNSSSKKFVYSRLPETTKHLNQLRARSSDRIENNNESNLILKASAKLYQDACWYAVRLPSCMGLLIVDLEISFCRMLQEGISSINKANLKGLPNSLLEDMRFRYTDKQLKQVLTNVWNQIISLAKSDISKIVMYSIPDDQLIKLDIKK